LELLARTDRTLSGVVDEIPRYAMVKEKFEVDRARIDRVLAAVRDTFAGERIDDADGIRIDFDAGWVHVRPSNTEPIIRIIGEGRDADAAMALIGRIRAVTDPLLA
jgi:phosphomannomutase